MTGPNTLSASLVHAATTLAAVGGIIALTLHGDVSGTAAMAVLAFVVGGGVNSAGVVVGSNATAPPVPAQVTTVSPSPPA